MNSTGKDEHASAASPNTVAGFGESPEVMSPLPKQIIWATRQASAKSMRTTNPIRAIVDPITKSVVLGGIRCDGKSYISLAVGGPHHIVAPNIGESRCH